MKNIRYLPVSWTSYLSLAQTLAARIRTSEDPPEKIIGISRCGLTLGHLLSDMLALPVSIIGVGSYTGIGVQGKMKLSDPLATPIRDSHIIVVDGTADSGKTLKYSVEYLERFHPRKISTAVVFLKPRSVVVPDFYAEKTDKWILFPYEMTEWITTFSATMQKEGKNAEETQRFLRSLGYGQQEIDFAMGMGKMFRSKSRI